MRVTGRVLGDFEVGELIGAGGFGEVYAARQRSLGRDVVVKVPRRRRQRRGDDGVARFLNEARLAARLDHPFAAHVYAFGAEADELLWIAMERVDGVTLESLLASGGALTLARFLPLFDRLCEVVHAAHELGIVHRDLKPANVMVLARGGRWSPKLLDLGIATLASDGDRGSETGLGSPFYMAPEQWLEPGAAGPRADLYSLAVLAYQALTGRLPFGGTSELGIARAHARDPVPPLPAGLPRALDGVFARALAKRSEDRFATALELAASLRAAAGADPAELPRLDEGARAAALGAAPQPIAAAVAALDGARNAHQAGEAVTGVVRAAARYLGVLARACRGRAGGDLAEAADLLRASGRRQLDAGEWLALARALCRPSAERAPSFPVPELVELFAGADAFAGLLEAHHTADEGEARADLERRVPALSGLLLRLGFLSSYPLVVGREGWAERWMGVGREGRPAARLLGDPIADGEPALLDAGGRPVLRLAPLAQLARPSPEAPEEIFFFAGRGARELTLVAEPRGFERADAGLWAWFAANLASLDEQSVVPAARPPYRGLAAFTSGDAPWFFGREREAEEVVNRLRVTPLLAVVGPSGAGKTSFVLAGVAPALADWRVLVVRPGASPMAALAARLEREGEALERAPDALGDCLRRVGPVLLVVDQLEELFTLGVAPEEQRLFTDAVARAARSADDPVRVVMTLRDDFLVRAAQLPALAGRLAPCLHLLTTPPPEALRRILVEPAARAGYDFDDPALPDEMVAAVGHRPAALALLSFTAATMWEARDRHFRRLQRAAYDMMGGVGGALAGHAERTLTALTTAQRALVREAFRHLCTAEGTRAVLARADLRHLLGDGAAADGAIERLIQARLLVTSDDDRIELVHEALLTEWPRLVTWRREDAEGARLRDALRSAAQGWDARGRARGLLWRGDALAEYRRWRARAAGGLTPVEAAFAAASAADEARGRRLRRAALFAVIAGLSIGLVALQRLNERARRSGAEATELLRRSYEEQGRRAILGGDPAGGLERLTRALRLGGERDRDLDLMLAQASAPLQAELALLGGHGAKLWSVAWAPDGRLLATSDDDGEVRLWDRDGRPVRRLAAHGAGVFRVEFDATGRRLACASFDRSASVWEVESGRRIARLETRGEAFAAVFRPGATTVAVASRGEPGAILWDPDRDVVLHALGGHEGGTYDAAFSPDGRRLVTAGRDNSARVWDPDSGAMLATLDPGAASPPAAFVSWARFSPDGARVVTASWDDVARLWDAGSGRLIAALDGERGNRNEAAFSPDGAMVVTTSPGQTAKLWDARGGALIATLRGHAGAINSLAVGADGRVATGSVDGTARLWSRHGLPLAAFGGHSQPVFKVAFDPDGLRLATASWDASARLWSAEAQNPVATLAGHEGPVAAVAFASGGLLVTAAQDALRVWDARGRLVRVLEGAVGEARVGAEGTLLVDGAARVWDVRRGEKIAEIAARGDRVVSVDISPDGARVAAATADGVVRLSTARGEPLAVFPGGRQVRFAPDGSSLVVFDEDSLPVVVWDGAAGIPRFAVTGHRAGVVAAAFSGDGRVLGTASLDRTVRLWDAGTGAAIATLGGLGGTPLSLAFSPDGTRFVTSCEDSRVRVADTATGRLVAVLEGHRAHTTQAVYSPDGGWIATAGGDHAVKIWSARSYRLLASLDGHASEVLSLAFSPDGTLLASAGRDAWASLWALRRERRSLTELERLRCRVDTSCAAE